MFDITILPAIIMLSITIIFTAVFFWPAIRFPQKNNVVNFYWCGVWAFLGMIAAVSGGQVTAAMLGQNAQPFSRAILIALTVTFVIFVVFGWGRLTLKGLSHVAQKIKF
jgi:hypothetical protein